MIDSIFIIAYFLLMLYIGFYFRKKNISSDDFFYGKGKIPWLWVGCSAFISQFSASSFTIIAGRAYTDGFSVLVVYWASAISFIFAALYFAPKLRQLKIASPVDALRMRFGKTNEKILSLLSIPSYLIFPALWLNSLAVFISGAFGVDTKTTIIVLGLITVLMSTLGGSWAIISSDFIQFIIILVLGVFTAFVAFFKIGGSDVLFSHIAPQTIIPQNMQIIVFVIWATYMTLQKTMNTNSILNTLRFNSVDSSISARRAAWTAVIIYIVGSFIWFIPAWASSILLPNIEQIFPNLMRPQMAAYLVFIQNFMPAGVLGLTVAALFAATMSSVDSSLNWCSGFLTRSFYKNNTVIAARFYTFLFGLLVIFIGLYYENIKTSSLFDLTYQLITYVYIPILIPILLALWIKKTPDWSFCVSIGLGLMLSIFMTSNKELVQNIIINFGNIVKMKSMSPRDISTISTVFGLLGQICIVGGFFTLSQLFFKGFSTQRSIAVEDFYTRLKTPVPPPEIHSHEYWVVESKTHINTIALGTALVIIEFLLFFRISAILFFIILVLTLTAILYKKASKKIRYL